MPLYRATVWLEPDLEVRFVEERAESVDLFKLDIRNKFIAEDVDREQVQFGPVSEVDEVERERRKKGVRRGFSS